MFEVIEFQRNGISPYRKFLEKLKDVKGRAIIAVRIDRIRDGNFGDHRNDIGKGISELRINFGLDIACITEWMEKRSSFYCLLAINPLSIATSSMQRKTGRSISMPSPKISTVPFEAGLLEDLKDSEFAAHFLDSAADYNDPAYFQRALGLVVKAQGGISKAAKRMKINRPNLNNVLAGKGNPSFRTLTALMTNCGLRFRVEAMPKRKRNPSAREIKSTVTARQQS